MILYALLDENFPIICISQHFNYEEVPNTNSFELVMHRGLMV